MRKPFWGVVLLIPLIVTAWLIGIPGGVGCTLLFKGLGVEPLGIVGTRLLEMIIYYTVFTLGLRLVLGRNSLGIRWNRVGLQQLFLGLCIGCIGVGLSLALMVWGDLVTIQGLAWRRMGMNLFLVNFFVYLVSSAAQGFNEEIAFRGYLIPVLQEGWGTTYAIVAGGVLFGMFHLPFLLMGPVGSTNWILLELIPLGILLSWVFVRTGSLWLSFGIHTGYHFAQQALDIYGRYGVLDHWPDYILLGNTVYGSRLLVGAGEGSAGLVQLVGVGIIIVVAWVVVKKQLTVDNRQLTEGKAIDRG